MRHNIQQTIPILLLITLIGIFSACIHTSPQSIKNTDIPPTSTALTHILPTEHVVELVTPTAAPFPTPTPLEIVSTVKELKAKIQAHFLTQGWVWVKTEYIINTKRIYVPKLPNGMDKPSHYLEDTWFHVDEKRFVDSLLMKTLSSDQEVLLVEKYKNGFSYSPMVSEPTRLDPWYLGDLDGGILDQTPTWASANKCAIEQIEQHGNQMIKISVYQKGPMPVEGLNQTVKLGILETYYDPIEGWPVKQDTKYILEDGTEFLAASQSYQIQTGLTPPDEVIKQIEEANLSAP